MSRRYRVGIVGSGHMHVNNVAALFAKHPQVDMAACADTPPARPEPRVAPYTGEWSRRNVIASILEAYKDPGKYPDLVVRVTGFSAYFREPLAGAAPVRR
jgi:predicted dehydrogenase